MFLRGKGQRTQQIQQFILREVEANPHEITRLVAQEFGISRQAAHYHVNKLVAEGLLTAVGNSRNRRYAPAALVDTTISLPLSAELQEDLIWTTAVAPLLGALPTNVLMICQYGLTEMLNNAIDHSEGKEVLIHLYRAKTLLRLAVSDDGVGIFRKIQREFELADPRLAILELAKGKLTTDPARHTGEGIFFTSRAFDKFVILSHELTFLHGGAEKDWLMGEPGADESAAEGTYIAMEIDPESRRNLSEVFDAYASAEDDYGFTRTVVPVTLAKVGSENLISRSQAKRLLARLDRFHEVVLDFQDVDFVGQAFADEIFRVHRQAQPQVRIVPVNASPAVEKMIQRALSHAG